MTDGRPHRIVFGSLSAFLILAGCAGSRETKRAPDEQFGHRYLEEGPAGRVTLTVTPPDPGTSYFYYPAVVDTVHFRPAPFTSERAQSGEVPVEILIKGSLPDACTELHDVKQERFGHIIQMRLETRRPQGAMCPRVVRPFRFYTDLEGLYGPGSYTVKLSGWVYHFTIRLQDAG